MKFKVNKVSHCPDLLNLCEILTGKIEKKGNEQVPGGFACSVSFDRIPGQRPY